jgi:DNA-binding NtrC family response regulator
MTSKILVVDDEMLLERLLKLRFRKKIRERELEFVFAQNGREALEKLLADRQFDMVLTDLNMPEMDGFTFLEQLQEIDSHLPAVVMSGDEDMTSMKTAMNRGALDFMTKPIDFHTLEVKISQALEYVRQMKVTITTEL